MRVKENYFYICRMGRVIGPMIPIGLFHDPVSNSMRVIYQGYGSPYCYSDCTNGNLPMQFEGERGNGYDLIVELKPTENQTHPTPAHLM